VVATQGVPLTYAPDKTKNYEIGLKGDLLEHVLTFDTSVYYIDWKNIQLLLIDPTSGASYNANASRAKSQGVELSVEARPLRSLIVTGWVAWNDAKLTEPFPTTSNAYGADGDRLPWSSRWSGNISIEQNIAITGEVTGFVGGDVSYVSNRLGFFTSTPARQTYPAYAKTDLRFGARYESWMAAIFANNITDRRAPLTGGVGAVNPMAFNYIQPRTIGLTVSKTF
jgi:iron complex outermembrane recepter protein